MAPRGPRGRVRWDRLGRISLLVVLMVVGALYVEHALDYLSAKSQSDKQLAIVHRLTRENAQLAQQERSLGNPATIVRDARALGMIKANERPYAVTGLGRH